MLICRSVFVPVLFSTLLIVGGCGTGSNRGAGVYGISEPAHLVIGNGESNKTEAVLNVGNAHRRTFCIGGNAAGHIVRLHDGNGNRLMQRTQGCRVVDLASGRYRLEIENADTKGRKHAVFLHPERNETMMESRVHGAEASRRSVEQTDGFFGASALAVSVIEFDRCIECDLHGAALDHRAFGFDTGTNHLSPVMDDGYFRHIGAEKTAYFSVYDGDRYTRTAVAPELRGSSLQQADLSYSVFYDADFSGVDFTDANLSHSVFIGCRFDGAVFERTDARHSIFIRPSFAPDAPIAVHAVSKPGFTRLKEDEGDYMSAYTALLSNGRIAVHTISWKGGYNTSVGPMPGGQIISSAAILPEDFSSRYTLFAVDGNGKLWSHGSPYGAQPMRGWHMLPMKDSAGNPAECKNAPGVTYWTETDGDTVKLWQKVWCDTGEEQTTWTKVTANRFTGGCVPGLNCEHGVSLSGWVVNAYRFSGLDGSMALNGGVPSGREPDGRYHSKAYVAEPDRGFYVSRADRTFGKRSAEGLSGKQHIGLISSPARASESEFTAVVLSDGHLYASWNPLETPYDDFGSPPVGTASAPAAGQYQHYSPGYGTDTYVAVRGGDGNIWSRTAGDATWRKIDMTAAGSRTTSLQMRDSRFDFSYFQGDARYDDIVSGNGNTYTGAYFSGVSIHDVGFAKMQNVVFSKADIRNGTFEDMDGATFRDGTYIADMNAAGKHIGNTLFADSVLESVSFDGTVFDVNVSFQNMNVRGSSSFSGATFAQTRFGSCRFSGVDFSGVDFSAIITAGSIIDRNTSDFVNAEYVPAALFYNRSDTDRNASVLRFHDFSEATFRGLETVDFVGAEMTGAKFHGVVLTDMDMNGSDWSGADISGMRFTKCSLRGAQLDMNRSGARGVHFDRCDLGGAYLSGDFKSAHFDGSDLSGLRVGNHTQMNLVHFTSTTTRTLKGADFHQVNLTSAVFAGAEFYATDFSQAEMASVSTDGGSKFVECDFTGSDLENASFDGTLFGGSCFYNNASDGASDNLSVFDRSGQTKFRQRVFGQPMETALSYTLGEECRGTFRPDFD